MMFLWWEHAGGEQKVAGLARVGMSRGGGGDGHRRLWGGLAAGGLQRVTEGGGAVDDPFVRREMPFARQEEPSDRREKASAKASASPSIGQAPSAQKAESRWP